jgi:membrane-bound ClpP family serine protease
MIDWFTVLSLILFGLALIVVEIIFVPGTTLVGLIGFGLLALGVGLSFSYFGNTIGWATTGGTALLSALTIIYCFKSNAWGRFSLKTSMDSKVNEGALKDLHVGIEGVTVSALRPIGKAELNHQVYEVKTFGDYLDTGKKIRIIEIVSNQIIVEHIN